MELWGRDWGSRRRKRVGERVQGGAGAHGVTGTTGVPVERVALAGGVLKQDDGCRLKLGGHEFWGR